jgi:hypothetical protein
MSSDAAFYRAVSEVNGVSRRSTRNIDKLTDRHFCNTWHVVQLNRTEWFRTWNPIMLGWLVQTQCLVMLLRPSVQLSRSRQWIVEEQLANAAASTLHGEKLQMYLTVNEGLQQVCNDILTRSKHSTGCMRDRVVYMVIFLVSEGEEISFFQW